MKLAKTEKVYTYELTEPEINRLIQYNLEHKKGIIAELEAIEGVEEVDVWVNRDPAVVQIKINMEHANTSCQVDVFFINLFKGVKRGSKRNQLRASRQYRKSA